MPSDIGFLGIPSTYIQRVYLFNLKKNTLMYIFIWCKIQVYVYKTGRLAPLKNYLFQGFVYFLQVTQLYRVYLECIPSWKQLHSSTAQYLFTIDRKYYILIIK